MERIIVDTSAIYALLDKSDDNHQKAKESFINLSKENRNILITNFILAECHAIISSRLGHELARKWLENLCWPVERITEDDEKRAREIILTYTDKSFSYTDATSFAVMERLGVTIAFAFDQHFPQFGFTLYGENIH
ncbi:MAG: PIN domain-containing protein [Firmicutes bacterium]|nr:PIN domain-containing protein [Bacillota bacterium]